MYVGLDLGGTFLKGARIDPRGGVVARLHEPIRKSSAAALLRQLAEAVQSLAAGSTDAILGIGMGVAGIVDRGTSRVRVSPAIPVLNDLPIVEELSKLGKGAVSVENDANVAALGEAWLGAGRGAEHLLMVTLGTGVGGGLLIGGQVFSGHSGYAGEVGHLQVDADGPACPCGSRGCVETVAGAPAWGRRAAAALAKRPSILNPNALDPEAIVAAAQKGDEVALGIVSDAARALGIGIAAALDLLNLDRVVLGGGVSAAGPLLIDRVIEEVRQRTFKAVFEDCRFCVAELGGDAGMIGAARLAMLAAAAPR